MEDETKAPDTPESAPPAFTDSRGDTWHPYIDAFVVQDIEKQTGFHMLAGDRTGVLDNIEGLYRVVFLTVRPEAKERNVTFKDFFERCAKPGMLGPMMAAYRKAAEQMVGDIPDDLKGEFATRPPMRR